MADGTSVGSLYYDLTIDDKNLKSQLDNADSNVKGFSDKLHDGLQKAAAGFAVVGAGLTLVAKNATDYTVQAVKDNIALGRQIGVSTEQASQLTAAFGRMGISAQSASQMFGIFSKQIVAATKDSKDHASQIETTQIAIDKTKLSISNTTAEIAKSGDKTGELTLKLRELNDKLKNQQASLNDSTNAFQKLGISTVDAGGKQKDFNTILFEVADKFKSMPNGIDKTALSMELFGRSGKEMVKVLNLGSQGIRDLEQQAEKLGLTLTPETVGKVEAYIQSQKDLKQSTDAMKIAIGTATAPVLTKFNQTLNEAVLKLLNGNVVVKNAAADFIAFGGPIFGAASAFFAFTANVAQAAPEIVKVTRAVREWTVAQFALDVALDVNPILLIVLAVAALTLGIIELVTHFDAVRDFLNSDWGIAISAAIGFIAPFAGVIIALVAQWQGFLNFMRGIPPFILSVVQAIGGFFVMLPIYAANAVNSVISWFASLPGRILGAIGNLGGLLYDAGRHLIEGMIHGITDTFKSLISNVKDAVGGAVKSIKNLLGIHSPSTVFQDIGKNVTAGFVKGITDTSHLAMGAMNQLANNVISPTLSLSTGSATAIDTPISQPGGAVFNIGQINNAQDEAFVLRRLDRNQFLEASGIGPTSL
jgi:hypothetical protein